MRKNLNVIILVFLVVTSEIVFGKETNKTSSKIHKNTKKNNTKDNPNIERIKRSLDDEEKSFWANRDKNNVENSHPNNRYAFDMEKVTKSLKNNDYDNFGKAIHYGMRNRRDSSSAENIDAYEDNYSNCKNCFGTMHFNSDKNFKDRRDDALTPFWGNRGRRSSDEMEDPNEPFWGNRGRRQDDEPFWGMRGRRKESPFWGARGRPEDEPFWGNRGRREEMEPFWGNRGRREDSDPFWGTRGRRQEDEPFWGNRGRREDEPFWGNRGRRKESETLGKGGRKKENLKESILEAINLVENDIEQLSRLRRSDQGFWSNRGRDSKLKYLFNNSLRTRITPQAPIQMPREFNLDLKSADSSTVGDSRIYAEEPQFIVVERSGRSSAEIEDPFYVSRGKKYYLNYNLLKAARDRRGAIEEIVKSVRNDPYYIARGKKATKLNATDDEFFKAKELICSAIDLLTAQRQNGKAKREIDSDRDRRTILKKLAAQLQIDPFPISRGKKNDGNAIKENNLHEFITSVAAKCV